MTTISCSALLLDMDGVLVDSTPAVARVWGRWALKHNLDPDPIIRLAHGRPSLTSIQELLPDADPAEHTAENNWMEQAEIEDIADVTALPGAAALLATIPPDQFCVVTSATRPLAEVRLRTAGLWQHIRHLITAADIQHGKPDPEPYRNGAAVLHVTPDGCVVIEDAPSGVRSGKAAGARVLALRTTMEDHLLQAASADYILNNCASLLIAINTQPRQIALEFDPNEPPLQPKFR